MIKNINEQLEKNLNQFIGKNIRIKQDGYLKSQYFMQKLKYSVAYDVLTLTDEKSENYLEINLNQVYQVEPSHEEIKIGLDNDTIILLKIE